MVSNVTDVHCSHTLADDIPPIGGPIMAHTELGKDRRQFKLISIALYTFF